MLTVKLIAIGDLKEKYLRDACEEYKKRLGAWCRVDEVILKEERIGDDPSKPQIDACLEAEEKKILEKISKKSFVIALCVEGKQMSSEELAQKIEQISLDGYSEIVFIIGSSHGLSQRVKDMASIKLSVSKLTFPHQLMRVILYEATYRALSIIHKTKYHK